MIPESDKRKISGEKEHFNEKAERYGHSWWGQSTLAGRQRLKRRQAILNSFLERRHSRLILEIGCGAGELTSCLPEGIDAAALDISFDLIKIGAAKNSSVMYLCGDVMRLPFKNETFDNIVGDGILHHLDLEPALSEVKRVLKPQGGILFFEPNMLNPQIFLERKIPFIRRVHQTASETAFRKRQLEEILEKNNWKKIRIKTFDFLHPATPEVLIPLAKKAGRIFEKTPLLKEIAGSLCIEAIKG